MQRRRLGEGKDGGGGGGGGGVSVPEPNANPAAGRLGQQLLDKFSTSILIRCGRLILPITCHDSNNCTFPIAPC